MNLQDMRKLVEVHIKAKNKSVTGGMKYKDGGKKDCDKKYGQGGLKPSNDAPETSDKKESMTEKLKRARKRMASMAVRG